MDKIFYWCVNFLKVWAKNLGMTYEEINVWLFCIIEPLVFLLLIYIIAKQYYRIKALKNNLKNDSIG